MLEHAEADIGAIYHATQTVLEPLDRSLDHFLRDLQVDARSAFLEQNMAPLGMRRDIAMLGFLHKHMLGDTHGDICSLLPLFLEPEARRCTRFRSDRPSCLFQETFDGTHPALIRRAISGSRVSTTSSPNTLWTVNFATNSSITSMYTHRTDAELEPLRGG